MLGAVLHKVPGLKLVKRRIMTDSYGLILEPIFDPNKHREELKFRDKVDGNWRVRDVMKWCVVKVYSGCEPNVLRSGRKSGR
jgi:transposase